MVVNNTTFSNASAISHTINFANAVNQGFKYIREVSHVDGSLMEPIDLLAGSTHTFTFEVGEGRLFRLNDELPDLYEITVDNGIANGTVTPNKTEAEENETITVEVTPDAGYRLVDGSLKVNNTEITAINGVYRFTMPGEDVEITAEVEPIPYAITIASGITNGAVSADLTEAAAQTVITLTVAPDAGCRLQSGSLTVNGLSGAVAVTQVNGTTYTFVMPAEDVEITATFDLIPTTPPAGATVVTKNNTTVSQKTNKTVQYALVINSVYDFDAIWSLSPASMNKNVTVTPGGLITVDKTCTALSVTVQISSKGIVYNMTINIM
jgi:hypothetical protein